MRIRPARPHPFEVLGYRGPRGAMSRLLPLDLLGRDKTARKQRAEAIGVSTFGCRARPQLDDDGCVLT
jgi:hypothetical protein